MGYKIINYCTVLVQIISSTSHEKHTFCIIYWYCNCCILNKIEMEIVVRASGTKALDICTQQGQHSIFSFTH